MTNPFQNIKIFVKSLGIEIKIPRLIRTDPIYTESG